ncbi:MAG: hypothetical protein H6704_07645 [Myxococcales bacterium]|nr:hypothetical protein [Myxococcales bacterium]
MSNVHDAAYFAYQRAYDHTVGEGPPDVRGGNGLCVLPALPRRIVQLWSSRLFLASFLGLSDAVTDDGRSDLAWLNTRLDEYSEMDSQHVAAYVCGWLDGLRGLRHGDPLSGVDPPTRLLYESGRTRGHEREGPGVVPHYRPNQLTSFTFRFIVSAP